MGIMYRQQVYTCGDYKQVRFYTVATVRRPARRKPHTKPTSAAQLWINQRWRQDKLTRLLNANFTGTDYEIHLTYSPGSQPTSADGVVRDVQNYNRRVRYACSRAGLSPPLYIWVPEGDGIKRRFHIHMTIQACLPRETLEALWGTVVGADDSEVGSLVFSKQLRFDRNGVEGLAKYVTKESREELEQMQIDPESGEVTDAPTGSPFKKAYYCSRGLKNPQAEVSVVSQKAVVDMCTVEAGSREPLEKRFPGWEMAEAHPFFDEKSARWFLYATMYRRGSFMSRVRGEEIERQRQRGRPPEPPDDDDLPW